MSVRRWEKLETTSRTICDSKQFARQVYARISCECRKSQYWPIRSVSQLSNLFAITSYFCTQAEFAACGLRQSLDVRPVPCNYAGGKLLSFDIGCLYTVFNSFTGFLQPCMLCKRNRRWARSQQDPAYFSATEQTGPVPRAFHVFHFCLFNSHSLTHTLFFFLFLLYFSSLALALAFLTTAAARRQAAAFSISTWSSSSSVSASSS